jgi:quercetin dioxygenase-like cupin family protein
MVTMPKLFPAGVLFFAIISAMAQQTPVVDITAEPSHHLVFQNEYVRVFDVTVAPRTSTLVHRHDHDYVYVTLGGANVTSARTDQKPAQLLLKDGETRFSAGGFEHAAINNSDQPFHNITIDLQQPTTGVKKCAESCSTQPPCSGDKAGCAAVEQLISSDQWTVSFVTIPPHGRIEKHTHATPHLVVAVSDLDLLQETGTSAVAVKRSPGGFAWVPAGVTHTLSNRGDSEARFVALDFTGKKQ